MKELIIQALNGSIELLERQVPLTIPKQITTSIEDVDPLDLNRFMLENNIPIDATFSVEGDSPCLAWFINVPTTEKNKLTFRQIC